MRIAGAHHRAAVFENLNVVNIFEAAQLSELFYPCVDDRLNFLQSHGCQGQIVTWRETNYAANPGFRFGDEQTHVLKVESSERSLRFQGREVIVEDESSQVRRVSNSARPQIAGAKVTGWIVGGLGRRRRFRDFALPWTHRALRRHQHPLVGQGIQSAMRIFREFQIAASGHSTMSAGEVRRVQIYELASF